MFDRWAAACIEDYKPVPEDEDWRVCPKCGVKPRIWVFDNGRHAHCLCCTKYGPSAAEAESIGDVYRRTGKTADYDPDALRNAWNARCEGK